MRLDFFYYSPKMIARLSSLSPDRQAFAALIVGAIAVGASPIFLKLGEIGPFAAAFHRAFLAIPVIGVLMMGSLRRESMLPETKQDFALLMLAGFFFAGDLAFWHLALFHSTVANAALFANFAPVVVGLAGWLLFRRHVGRVFLGGMALALIGAFCLVQGSLAFRPSHLEGDAYGLITACFLAGYLMVVDQLRSRYRASVIMFWSTIGTALWLLPLALTSGDAMWPNSASGWVLIFALAWVSQALGQNLIAYSLAALPVNVTAVGLLLEPLAAAILAMFFLGEALSSWQIVGGGIILLGVVLARVSGPGVIKSS